MIKLVVFDWNGTLISDTVACMEADNHVLKVFGGKPVNLNTFRKTFTVPVNNFYIQHGCKEEELIRESKKLGETFHTFYERRVSKVRTRKNTRELLKWLFDNNIQSVLLSNHTLEGITNQLKRLEIEEYFTEVLANTMLDAAMKKRNKMERLEDYFKQSKLKSNEIIIIGDSPEEVEMGKNINIKTVAITNGFFSTPRLIKSFPDYLINNLNELIDIIKKDIPFTNGFVPGITPSRLN